MRFQDLAASVLAGTLLVLSSCNSQHVDTPTGYPSAPVAKAESESNATAPANSAATQSDPRASERLGSASSNSRSAGDWFAAALGIYEPPRQVIVTDSAGKPLANVSVYAVSESTNAGEVKTNSEGKATVPGYLVVQRTEWISASKAGFESTQLSVPAKWPLHITLSPVKSSAVGSKRSGGS
jgi:hypothetical protein